MASKVVKTAQTSFLGGELTPKLLGRSDLQKYQTGVKTLENMLLLPHGAAQGRPGTHWVAEVKDSTKNARLLPFEFSTTQAYILEFGDIYFRIYRDNGRVEVATVPTEVVTTYVHTDLAALQYAQSADTLYLAHSTYPPKKVTRTSHTAWTISTINFGDGPYLSTNVTTTTITPSGVTGAITLTASAALFQAGHVGAIFKIGAGYVTITGFTSNVLVNATVVNDVVAAATTNWAEGAWSAVQGYPGAVGFYEGRLCWAGSTALPQTVWCSVTNDFENQKAGTAASDALIFKLADTKVNIIRWLSGTRTLLAGSVGNEFSISGGSNSPLTPTSIQSKSQTTYGSAQLQPIRVAQDTLFVQRAGKKVLKLAYDYASDNYQAPDVTLLSEHVSGDGFRYISYQQEPYSHVWFSRADGQIATLAYNPSQEINAWSRMITDGTFESLATIPDVVNNVDQVWCIAKRTIGVSDKRYVEYFDPTLHVDSGLTYNGGAVSSVSGLTHLEGKTVNVVGDGAVFTNQVVTGGAITFGPPTATVIQVGLPFTPKVVTLPPEIPAKDGTVQGRPIRWAKIQVRLLETKGLNINGQEQLFRSASMDMGVAIDAFTGTITTSAMAYTADAPITLMQNYPLPVTILGIYGVLEVGEV